MVKALFTCEVISIHLLKHKLLLNFLFFVIGVIFIVVSLIQINRAYAKVEQAEDYFIASSIPFYWMIMLIGGIIIITLSYVSWRKYQGEKKSKQKRDSIN